jgi:putative ABC transport system ATP-binding protein
VAVSARPEENAPPSAGVRFSLEEGAQFAYPGGAVILRDLQLALESRDVEAGQTVAVLGRSGVGKTTLLHLLALLWEARPARPGLLASLLRRLPWGKREGGLLAGRITYRSPRIDEVDYHALPARARARLRREEFGVVPQVSHFLSGLTCRQNLLVPLALQGLGGKKARERLDFLLDEARREDPDNELAGALRKWPGEASTGQRQRLSVLRAVAHDPVVLFADEPVSNLDDRNKGLMLRLFHRWLRNELRPEGRPKQPRLLVLICHEAETAWEIADQFLFLDPPHPPPPKGEPGAKALLRSRAQFCEEAGKLDSSREGPAARVGAQALRERISQGPNGSGGSP